MTNYDVIVVGAGAGGAPLAARLSEDPSCNVLLLEAGPDYSRTDDFPADLLDPGLMTGAMPGHPNNWGFVARLTPELPYIVSRGRILGGSTALNGTYFIRGRKADFDGYAAQGNPEWSYEKVLPFFRKLENDLTYGSTAVHGGDGPVPIDRVTEKQHPMIRAFNAACAELGFVEEPDKNAESEPGYGPLPVNAVDGFRINTGIAYVNTARSRANLTVHGNTFVRRVVLEGTRAIGVEVENDGKISTVLANEIVLSAGAFKSPHILALSGIGPRTELEAAGIPVVVDLPGVGKDFSDHPDIPINWVPRQRLDTDSERVAFQSVLNFTAQDSDHVGDLEILPQVKTLGALLGLDSANISGFFDIVKRPIRTLKAIKGASLTRLAKQLVHQYDTTFAAALQQADSRGTVTTVSADPDVYPEVEYNYLQSESDLRRMREVVRTTVRILRSEAFKPHFKKLAELNDTVLEDDARLNKWMKSHLATAIHASGSCRMGPDPESGAVVDQFGRVHGITGLRVADSSILPFVPSRGPAATTMMIGERMAELMTRENSRAGSESAANESPLPVAGTTT